jgi:bisphosphoglycerate-dependent phosphoglycerate mutase
MKLSKQMLDAKLKQIAQFEETYGSDHGQSNVHAMKKFCTDEKYRERVRDFNKSIAETYDAYRFKTPYND